jgi:hypothetical protein
MAPLLHVTLQPGEPRCFKQRNAITTLTNLRELSATPACIGKLPHGISTLTTLTRLRVVGDLHKARFEALLPAASLRSLALEHYGDSFEAEGLKQAAALKHLPALTELKMGSIGCFRDWVGLGRLRCLQSLALTHCSLDEVPA